MNIAELFVRVRGDTTDVSRKLRLVTDDLDRVEKGAGKAHLSTGKLRQEMLTLARQVTGVHPIVSQFGGLLTDFAVGGPIGLAVIGGITAIVAVISSLGDANRKAREETDKTTQSLVDQARAAHLATVEGAEQLQLIQEMNLQQVKAESSFGIRTILKGAITGNFKTTDADAEAHAKRVADATTAVEQATVNVGKAGEEANKKTKTQTKDLSAGFMELQNAAEKVNAEILQEKKDWWKNYIESTGRAITITQQLAAEMQAAQPSVIDIVRGMTTTDVPAVDISHDVKVAGEQAKQINDAAAKHTEMLKDAIWGSAIQGASIIVNALNIGGGGRGSGLGGALGSTAGFAAGFAFGGPIGGAIGSTLGTITGSLIGGLFDHKKATDRNTDALNRVANLLNAPSGFKGAYYTYQAEDARRIYRNMEEEARRQTTRGGSTGFALRAGR